MGKVYATLLMAVLAMVFGLIGCENNLIAETAETELPEVSVVEYRNDDYQNIVKVNFKENTLSIDSNVSVQDYYTGGRAEAIYLIYNETPDAIIPNIFVDAYRDVASYEEANENGFVKATSEEIGWLQIPKISEIPSGGVREITLAYETPEYFEIKEDKIAFLVEVSYPDKRGQVILAVGNWWLIDMKD